MEAGPSRSWIIVSQHTPKMCGICVLQKLMGSSDLQILRRYLAQNDEDNQLACVRGSPFDNNF
jgi:hypothetical protein